MNDLERLARVIYANEYEPGLNPNELPRTPPPRSYQQAQAIHDAGWTPPPEQDPPKTVLEILKEKLATTNTTHPADYHLTVLPGNPDRNEVTLRMETRAFDHPKPTWLDN